MGLARRKKLLDGELSVLLLRCGCCRIAGHLVVDATCGIRPCHRQERTEAGVGEPPSVRAHYVPPSIGTRGRSPVVAVTGFAV